MTGPALPVPDASANPPTICGIVTFQVLNTDGTVFASC